MFHPLITPLTTYMYTTDIHDSGTVSATDDERLPPGGFSLRHGFPGWFGRGSRDIGSRKGSGQHLQTPSKSSGSSAGVMTPDTGSSGSQTPGQLSLINSTRISTYDVLRYIRSTLDDEAVLDDIPLEAAGNPGAWHAWKTHRIKSARNTPTTSPRDPKSPESLSEKDPSISSRKVSKDSGGSSVAVVARKPGEWNWDGVWEVRVKKGIESSLSDPMLYGNSVASNDDLVSVLLKCYIISSMLT